MKRMLAVVFALSILVPATVPAQQIVEKSVYEVQPGDTLWDLAGAKLDDPRQWRKIVESNPFLQEAGRIFERGGKIIALIRSGEKLAGLEAIGVLPNPLPLGELGLPQLASPGFWGNLVSGPFWFWLLLAALVALAILGLVAGYRFFAQRLAHVDPTTAGPAFVEPTIQRTPELVEHRFDRIAQETAARRDPVGTAMPQRISAIEAGRLTGRGRVRYRDASARDMNLNRERAYRARYRMPDGSEEMLYSLAGCMNPVALFVAPGFTWVEEREVVPPPASPQPEPAAPVPQPASLRVVAETPGPTAVTFGDIEITVPHGSRVELASDGRIAIEPQPGTITVARKAKAKRMRPKVVRPAATAGSQQSS